MDGWDEEDDLFPSSDDDDNNDERITTAKNSNSSSALNSFQQHHDMSLDLSSPPPAVAAGGNNNREGIFDRAAGAFGAALLASMDHDDDSPHDDNNDSNNDEDDDSQEEPQTSSSFSFGKGFVMKGLQGFIEAATTAPPNDDGDGWDDDEEVDDDDLEEDGWSQEDELELDDDNDDVGEVEEKNMSDTNADSDALKQDGWDDDDFDLDISGPMDEEPQLELSTADTNTEGAVVVSDELKDFVAKTESTLNSAFQDASKTPTRTPRDGRFIPETKNHHEPMMEGTAQQETEEEVVSKSLTEFVDNLDNELNVLKESMEDETPEMIVPVEKTTTTTPIQAVSDTYNFEENKNNSPEPIVESALSSSSSSKKQNNVMPHQDSWYLNAMEGGAGGIVHSEKINIVSQERMKPKDQDVVVMPMESELLLNDAVSETPVGMPISEVPSIVNSDNGSDENSTKLTMMTSGGDNGNNNLNNLPLSSASTDQDVCNYQTSELQCKCLELILPLPEDNNGNGSSEESGYGTKILPDGTTVLVNYEKLLQNEATKRILLQRSVDTYERTMEKMQRRYQSAMKSSQEQGEASQLLQSQLLGAQNENITLRELVAQLERGKDDIKAETPSSEAHLFQEELVAACNEKERFQKEANDLREQLKQLQEQNAAVLEARDDLIQRLEKTQAEQSRLEDLVQMVQSDLSEAQQTNLLLQSENDAIQQELNAKSIESVENDNADEVAQLKEKIVTLEHELDAKTNDFDNLNAQLEEKASKGSDEIDSLKQEKLLLSSEVAEMREVLAAADDEKRSLREMQNDSQARIIELSAMVESLEHSSGEIDRLSAENASLTYKLGVKSGENDDNLASIKSLQAEIDETKARLLTFEQIPNGNDASDEIEVSLREEIKVLKTNIVNMQNECATKERSKLDLESALDEKDQEIQALNAQAINLQSQAAHAAVLQKEVTDMKETIIVKENELRDINDKLNSHLMVSNNEHQLSDSREELSTLQSQFNEFRQHHTNTMDYMEKQMSGLMQQKIDLDAQLEECRNALERAHHENSELNKALSEKGEQVSKLEGENLKISAELKVAQSNDESSQDDVRVQELSNERTQLRVMLDQQQNDLTLQRRAFEDLSQEYDDARSHMERVQMEHGNVLARNRALEQDNKSLEYQLTENSSKTNQLAATNRALEQDKISLEFQFREASSKNEKLETKLASLQSQMREQEQEALDAIAQWEARCSSLETERAEEQSSSNDLNLEVERLRQEVVTLNGQLRDLTNQLESIQSSTSVERERLLLRVAELEQEVKDGNVNDLRDELTSLHEERQQLDLDNEELLVQLGLMQQSKIEHDEEVQDELTRLRGQVATLQDNNAHLQTELNQAKNTVQRNNDELNSVVERLNKENTDLQDSIFIIRSEKDSLENDINNITENVKSLELQLRDKESDNAEITHLKEQIEILETKLATRERDASDVQQLKNQVNQVTATVLEMENALEQKDDAILKLTAEGCLRETTLKDMERQAEAKSIVDCMQVNFNAEEKYDEDDDDSLQDLLADDVESDDYLRHQIVILAQALERSELQRADVLDRLTKERKGNADSLKALGESVKRFYSTVRSSAT